ncbi:MAG: 2-oxoglutarate dehydrogenase E1 component [Bacteroidota bacterium]
MSDYSFVSNAHPSFIDSLYQDYQNNPENVELGWRRFFEGFDYAYHSNGSNGTATATADGESTTFNIKEFYVFALIFAFRNRGHLLSTTNPIRERRDRRPMLHLEDYSLSEADLDTPFIAGKDVGLRNRPLREIIDRLNKIYAGNIGFEYNYITSREKRAWLRDRIEADLADGINLSEDKKRRILEKLNGAVVFEEFLHKKYLGQKRFSLEGGETTIAAIDAIINQAAKSGVKEVVIGMAHRGRLNVLANIMGKTYEHIFNEFEGNAVPDTTMGDGDVKYHLGYSSQVETPDGDTMQLKLAPNPSHLEAVNTVVQGFARAKADILYGSDYDQILPILIHGDAAFAGQGIVYETVQMSKLEGYYTGGTIHYVINNQIGFTTDWDDARSATYCTGVASMIEAPVFHVNGDDPEAVIYAVQLAMEYRQKFNSDVFIDMVCYRRHGHNEGDDPKFTQPEMYEFINKHKNPREIYSEILVSRGDIDAQIAEDMEKVFWSQLQDRLDEVKEKPLPYSYQEPELAWKQLKKLTTAEDFEQSPETGIKRTTADAILKHITTIPADFKPLSKVNRLYKGMKKLMDADQIDWALGELMAYGSIMLEGKNVRMSGQDVKRGTFSHRHAVLHDAQTFKEYNRLTGMSADQGKHYIYNSLLSEFGVLGFEFGYSMASPDSLVIWEAQFGDFYNGAQVMVDQFIAASESKWRRMSGLIMLLPHGYEGQGPEHSSARLERFLQQSAEFNMTVANVTSPANFFHLIRRQLARPFRKPLVVMSPKSLLRHKRCVSSIDEVTKGHFRELIDDPIAGKNKTSISKVKRLLVCSGKIYYDLLDRQEAEDRKDVAIVRLEQLYPFPQNQVEAILEKYKKAEMFWVQEEPENMGGWQFILSKLRRTPIELISRKVSASPATGFKKVHEQEQQAIIDKAFAQ